MMNRPRWLTAGLVFVVLALLSVMVWRVGREMAVSTRQSAAIEAATNAKAQLSPSPIPLAATPLTAPNSIQTAITLDRAKALKAISATPFSDFDAWAERFLTVATPDLKTALVAEGSTLARTRRDELKKLIKANPKQALDLAVPYRVRRELPKVIADELEERLSGRANFAVLGVFPLPGQPVDEPILRRVTLNEKTYQAYVYGQLAPLNTRLNLPLYGIAVDDFIAVHENPLRLLEPEEAQDVIAAGRVPADPVCVVSGDAAKVVGQQTLAEVGGEILTLCRPGHGLELNQRLAASELGGHPLQLGAFGAAASAIPDPTNVPPNAVISSTIGPKTLLYIRVVFPDDPAPPITEGQANALMKEVNDFFVENSYNATAIIPTISPLVVLPQIKRWYFDTGLNALYDHARAACKAAGFDHQNYDLDMVHFVTIGGARFNFGGLAFIGGRGIWLQGVVTAGLINHELGHNYGLRHANFWDTIRTALPALPGDNSIVGWDPDSVIGHDSIFGPGLDVEYGDIFDTMGGIGGTIIATAIHQFNTIAKFDLKWLPPAHVKTVTETSSTNRVYAFDVPNLVLGRAYAVKVRKDFERNYWAQFRSKFTNNVWQQNGVELHWNSWTQGRGQSQLLDTTPGSSQEVKDDPGAPGATRSLDKEDSALVIGRTLIDDGAGVYITPTAKGGASPDNWIDVVVNLGPFPANRPPTLTITNSTDTVGVGVPVNFSATATDPNGDSLAYYWDFGDETFGGNAANVGKRWTNIGQYVVRCEVSDMKGGLASAYKLINVGLGATNVHSVSGRILDPLQNPVANVRVHNGLSETNYVWTFTDSQGYYTLPNLPPGTYTNAAALYGYKIAPYNFRNPIALTDADAVEVNYIATPISQISVTTDTRVQLAEANTPPAVFTVTRTGPTNFPLAVFLRISGSATAVADYTTTALTGDVTNYVGTAYTFLTSAIPAGAYSTNISITPVDDDLLEGPETITVAVELPVQYFNDTNVFYVPGWEPLPYNLEYLWFLTYPTYVLGKSAEATITLQDNDSMGTPKVSVIMISQVTSESGPGSGLFRITRDAGVNRELRVFFTMKGEAINGVDYLMISNSATIPIGQYSVDIPVVAVDDLYVEGSETAIISLEPNMNYTVDMPLGNVTIVDNDLPIVTINATDPIASEPGNDTGTLLFSRAGSLAQSLEVNYLVRGSAIAGRDYVPLRGSVTIPPGSSTTNLTVQALDNGSRDSDKFVEVYISDSPIYNIGSPSSAQVIIQDNELPFVNITASTNNAVEGGAASDFTLTRTGSTATDLEVNYVVTGTAIPKSDYESIGTNFVMPAGLGSVLINVRPINDSFREVPESVVVQLVPSTNYNVGPDAIAGVIIVDDDSGKPAIGFSLLTSQALESASNVLISVSISAPPNANETVTNRYTVTGGSADNGTDFVLTNGVVVFAENSAVLIKNIRLLLLDDMVIEPNETIIITLLDPEPVIEYMVDTNQVTTNAQGSNVFVTNIVVTPTPTNAYFDAYKSHLFTILDNDSGIITIRPTERNAFEEGLQPASFTITREGSTNTPLTVTFQVTGTAATGVDFQPLGTSITIPPGLREVVMPVVPVDDPEEEANETVRVTLISAPTGTIGTPNSALVFILDNDGTLEFTTPSFNVLEKDGTAALTVKRTGPTNDLATVNFATTNGSATAGNDYTATNGTLTFGPGETIKTIFIPIIDDTVVETNETVIVTLSNSTGGAPLGGQRVATLTILDDDTAFTFDSPNFTVNENATNALVKVNRIGITTNAVSVEYFTFDGTATNTLDYLGTNGILNFAAGETNKTFNVRMVDDILFEGNETVNLYLTNASPDNSLGTVSNAVLTILDDEGSLEFDAPTYDVIEYAGSVTVNVRRVGGTVNAVRVDFATSDITARAGSDYSPLQGTVNFRGDEYFFSESGTGALEFRSGDTNKTIVIAVIDDTFGEGNESFNVTLSNARGPQTGTLPGSTILGAQTNTVVRILDNELPGQVDYESNPGSGANDRVFSVALASDGSLPFGGDFNKVDGVIFLRVARLHRDGYLDSSFNPGAGVDNTVLVVAAQADGKVLLGGSFATVDSVSKVRLARLNVDGSLDFGFTASGLDGVVRAIVAQPDGAILIGGEFNSVNGLPRARIARLTEDGTVDINFDPGFGVDGPVYSIALAPDGKVVIGGQFGGVNNRSLRNVARLNADGSVDDSFNPGSGTDARVNAVAVQPDGAILLGGEFVDVNGVNRAYVARLKTDGSLDAGFNPDKGANGTVWAVGITEDGKVVIGGDFTKFNDISRPRLARLNADGSLDETFDPGAGANNVVRSLVVQQDSAIVIGGDFTVFNGLPRNRIARIHGDDKFNLGRVGFSSSLYQVAETAGSVTINVIRSGNTDSPLSVDFLTIDGTAQAGVKYVATNGTLNFGPGETNQSFMVEIIDEAEAEGNEAFTVALTNAPPGVNLSDQSIATVVILDDESSVEFTAASFTVNETNGTATITVRRTGAGADVVSVDYATSDGTAKAGVKYQEAKGTLNFAIGETNKSFTVPIINEDQIEGDQTVLLSLSNPVGNVALGRQSKSVLTIIDDDASPPSNDVTLTIEEPAGGRVFPAGGKFAPNTIINLIAVPARGFSFVRWEGDLISTANPLVITITNDLFLRAVFSANEYTDDFESGDLLTLPWEGSGAAAWTVQSDTAAGGRFAARSGPIGDSQTTSLLLRTNTAAGVGYFFLRVSSEPDWDFLEFRLNGRTLKSWSGDVDWQPYSFAVPAGENTFEWRFSKDANFSRGFGAAFIDNVIIPLDPNGAGAGFEFDKFPPVLSVQRLPDGQVRLRLVGLADRTYNIEASSDLITWTKVATPTSKTGIIELTLNDPLNLPLRFYRAVLAP